MSWAGLLMLVAGCAGPGPEMFPAAPFERRVLPDGEVDHIYDLNGDGRGDFCEHLSAAGRVVKLRYDPSGAGRFDDEVELAKLNAADSRDLILLLDSIPFELVREAWEGGRFRYFPRPSRVVSVFPVMTDPAFCEFFGDVPCPAVESEYYDGRSLTNPYATYINGGNTPWQAHVDYRLTPIAHARAYLNSYPWYLHELGRIQRLFLARTDPRFVGYVVSTSALGAQYGRDGHQVGLVQLDRFCQSVMYRTRGRTRVTLLSDHGQNLVGSKLLPLPEMLTRLGYRVTQSLEGPEDVVLPQFGIVTYASIHTKAPERVAADVAGMEGIEFAAYVDGADDLVVVGQGGLARISRRGTPATTNPAFAGRGGSGVRFRYQAEYGDPLRLNLIWANLKASRHVGDDGFVDDAILFEATKDHVYPDGVHRLWRAFHGLFAHTPDVMVSIEDGYHSGSAVISTIRVLAAAHGNLGQRSSYAFAMTTAGELPETIRNEDLRQAMMERGVRFPPRVSVATTGTPTVTAH